MKIFKLLMLSIIILAASANIAFSQVTATKAVQKTAETKTITVKVKNVTCPVDLKMICDNVEKLEGVSACKVAKKGATTKLDVTMTSTVKKEDIYAAIENTGTCEDPNDRRYKVKKKK